VCSSLQERWALYHQVRRVGEGEEGGATSIRRENISSRQRGVDYDTFLRKNHEKEKDWGDNLSWDEVPVTAARY